VGRLARGGNPRGAAADGTRRRLEEGAIFLDVLVALFIVMVGFAAVIGGLGLAAALSARHDARVQAMIEQRNVRAEEHTVVFRHE